MYAAAAEVEIFYFLSEIWMPQKRREAVVAAAAIQRALMRGRARLNSAWV